MDFSIVTKPCARFTRLKSLLTLSLVGLSVAFYLLGEAVTFSRKSHQPLRPTTKVTVIYERNGYTEHNRVFIDPKLDVNDLYTEPVHNILFWNAPGWMESWFNDVNFNQCSYKNCNIVHDKRAFGDSSAVVFSTGDSGMGLQPPVTPDKRNPDQAWLFFTLESPIHLKLRDFRSEHWHNALNWSWTYRTDADIFHPYGILKSRLELPQKNYTQIFRGKSKQAAWAVSNCRPSSRREWYVHLMRRHSLSVDIYGRCGKDFPRDFDHMLDSDYKFYIGFENSLCHEYMTEKFFQYYKRDIITVVRGNMDYSKHLPNGTFINTADFSSVKALTEFMTNLAANETEYIKYLKNKDRYEVKQREFMFREALCNVCHKLNHLEENRKTYADIAKWYGRCQTKINDLHR